MGADTKGMSEAEAAEACLGEIRKLSKDIGIPSGIQELGAKASDLPALATNALKDACGLTNPLQATHEEIVEIYRAAL